MDLDRAAALDAVGDALEEAGALAALQATNFVAQRGPDKIRLSLIGCGGRS